MFRPLLALLLAATVGHANYADDAYAATFKLYNSALSGTCSLYRRPAPDTAVYLVTTQHQLEGSKGDYSQLVLREPQPDGSYKRNDFKVVTRINGKPTWVKHPKFDLAVLRLATPPTGTFATLPTSAIANDERLKASRSHPYSPRRRIRPSKPTFRRPPAIAAAPGSSPTRTANRSSLACASNV